MTTSKIALAAAAALLAATAVPAVSTAGDHGGGIGGLGREAYCKEYKQRAVSTGEEYWWTRYRQCMSGWN